MTSTATMGDARGERAGESHRIGPNAITQLAAAIESHRDGDALYRVFKDAGIVDYLDTPPGEMVDEHEVCRLHHALRNRVGYASYRGIARLAGNLTGDYLLANRIPGFARQALPRMPRTLASRILTRAIERNSWTFVGSGRFHWLIKQGSPVLIIEDSPLARGCSLPGPACDYYAGTFERLYRQLSSHQGTLQETSCIANGAEVCRFEFD